MTDELDGCSINIVIANIDMLESIFPKRLTKDKQGGGI